MTGRSSNRLLMRLRHALHEVLGKLLNSGYYPQ
jgi:hypothetical protein